MKKTVILTLIISMISPLTAFALTKSDNVKFVDYYYSAARDQYIINYYFDDYSTGSPDSMQYVFVATINDVTYTRTWPADAVNKTIYVNCNGMGNWYFKRNNQIVGYIEDLAFTQINNQICLATIPGTSDNSLNLTGTDGNLTNGATYNQKRIDYTKIPNGNSYNLKRSDDGGDTWNTINTNTAGDDPYFVVNSGGFYKLDVTNNAGDLIATDIIGENEFTGATCDGCQWLQEILACPAWDDYLSGFSDMLAGVIPTPSDLNDAADYLVDKLSEQDVAPDDPVVPPTFDPGYPEQQTDLPAPVTTDINPQPTDFEPVTTGDGSGAFTVTDPLAWTPDDNDKNGGYIPPNPDSNTPPAYTEPGGNEETPPTYSPPGGTSETPPTYTPPGGAGDDIPNYTPPGGTGGTMPTYNAGGGTGNDVPDYDYGG